MEHGRRTQAFVLNSHCVLVLPSLLLVLAVLLQRPDRCLCHALASHPTTTKTPGHIAPKFTQVPIDQRVHPKSHVSVTCVANGYPKPFVRWRQGANYAKTKDAVPIGESVLYLSDVRQTKNYTCEAFSDLGEIITHDVQITVLAPGSPPENLTAKAVSDTTLLVSWDEPNIPNGPIKGYKLFYTDNPGEPILSWTTLTMSNTSRRAEITNLKAKKTYIISILAFSDLGRGIMSHPIHVNTSPGVPTGSPQNITATALNETSVHLTWDPIVRKHRNGIIIKYQVTYHRLSDPVVAVLLDSSDTFVDIVGLQMNTYYVFKVKGFTDQGYGPESKRFLFRTFGQTPDNTLKTVAARAIDATTVLVNWDKPKNPNGLIQGYKVFYTKHPMDVIFFWKSQAVRGNQHEMTLRNLTANQTYTVRMMAFSTEGHGSVSAPIQVVTPLGAPVNTPENVTALGTSANTVLVSWVEPRNPGAPIKAYRVFYTQYHKTHFLFWKSQAVRGRQHEMTLRNLTANQTYTVRVMTITVEGQVALTHPIQVATPCRDITPTNVTARATSATSVLVFWDEPTISNRLLIKGYKVFYTKHPLDPLFFWKSQAVRGSQHEMTLRNLTANQTYTVRMMAFSTEGHGSVSSPIQVVTPLGAPDNTPRNVTVRVTGDTTVLVSWDEPKNPNDLIKGYKVFYTKHPMDPLFFWKSQAVRGNQHEMTLRNLTANQTYTVRMMAFSTEGHGSVSAPIQVVTPLGVIKTEDAAERDAPPTSRLHRQGRMGWDVV